MSKSLKTMSLIGTVMFSLSWLPGFSADAGSRQTDMSSSDVRYEDDCNINAQLANGNNSTECRVRNGTGTTTGRVTARIVPRQALRTDDPGMAPGGEEVEVRMEARTSVAGCDRCDKTSVTTKRYQISELRTLTASALTEFAKTAQVAAVQASEVASETKKIENCEINPDTKQALEGRDKRNCLLVRIRALQARDPEAAARFYDEQIKNSLMEMLKSERGQTVADGMKMLKDLEGIVGKNPYLKESLYEMKEFGKYHAYVTMMTRQIESMRPNDPRRGQFSAALAEYMGRANGFFEERGMTLNDRIQNKLSEWSYSGTWAADLNSFQGQINDIYSRHQAAINGGQAAATKTTNPALNATGVNAGRTAFGTPYIANPATAAGTTGTARPAVTAPRAQVPAAVSRPGTAGRAANGGPLIGGR